MNSSRRRFISRSIAATSLLSALSNDLISGTPVINTHNDSLTSENKFSVSVFSKMLHWLNYSEMASFVKEAGFDGVDLTVRPKGHVLPERVSEDLPKAFEILKSAGLNVFMITTAITKADEPYTESILKTASSLGIKHYRMGWINYDNKISIEENLKAIEKQLRKLADINSKYKMTAEYQNHTGANFGSPMWDLYMLLNKINSPWLGSQFDIYHATVEAANSWTLGLELLKPFIKTIDVKDFMWGVRDGKQGRRDVPLGSGNVDFPRFFEFIKKAGIRVPVSIHFEYDLGGAESGASEISMPREKVLEAMKRDVEALKVFLS